MQLGDGAASGVEEPEEYGVMDTQTKTTFNNEGEISDIPCHFGTRKIREEAM